MQSIGINCTCWQEVVHCYEELQRDPLKDVVYCNIQGLYGMYHKTAFQSTEVKDKLRLYGTCIDKVPSQRQGRSDAAFLECLQYGFDVT